MALYLEINGVKYERFIRATCTKSLDTLAGSFSFTASRTPDKPFPIKARSFCRVLVDETPVLTGYVEQVAVDYSSSDHSIEISGRSVVGDLLDSTVGPTFEFKAPVTLEAIVKAGMKRAQLSRYKVFDKSGGIKPFSAADLIAGAVDNQIFDVLEQYARKRQVLLTSDGDGNVLIVRAGNETAPIQLVNLLDKKSTRNNILDASASTDDTDRYHTYTVYSQKNPTTLGKKTGTDNKKITRSVGKAIDPEIRPGRVLDILAESSSDDATCKDRAVWEANVRKARALKYRATVQGHTPANNGTPWDFNKLIEILDEFWAVNSPLLIEEVEFSYSVGDGSRTTLTCVNVDAYRLRSEPGEFDKDTKRKKKRGRKKRGSVDPKVFIDYDYKPPS